MNAKHVQLAAAVLRDMDHNPPPFGELVEIVKTGKGIDVSVASPALWLAQDERMRRLGLTVRDGMVVYQDKTDPLSALAEFFGIRRVLMHMLFLVDRGYVEEKSISLSRFARDLEYIAEHDMPPPYMQILYSVDVFPEHFDEVKRDYEAGIIGANQYEELPDL